MRAIAAVYAVLMFCWLAAADRQGSAAASPIMPEAVALPHAEAWYQERLQAQVGGFREVPVPRGRVDVLTTNRAIEVDTLPHAKEAIGQALWYAWHTRRAPCVALIVANADLAEWRAVRNTITSHSAIAVLRIDATTGKVSK